MLTVLAWPSRTSCRMRPRRPTGLPTSTPQVPLADATAAHTSRERQPAGQPFNFCPARAQCASFLTGCLHLPARACCGLLALPPARLTCSQTSCPAVPALHSYLAKLMEQYGAEGWAVGGKMSIGGWGEGRAEAALVHGLGIGALLR